MLKKWRVFLISLGIVLLFIIWGVIPEDILPNGNLDHVTSIIQDFIVARFGWFYLISASGFVARFVAPSVRIDVVRGKRGMIK